MISAKYTTLCKLSDPKLSQCLTSLMKDILKHSRSGKLILKFKIHDINKGQCNYIIYLKECKIL